MEFALNHLFNSISCQSEKPSHVLCNGYKQSLNSRRGPERTRLGFCGVNDAEADTNASIMQGKVWQTLLKLLGKDGDQVMLDLILHCGIFVSVSVGKNNLYQLSGNRARFLARIGANPCRNSLAETSRALFKYFAP